MRSGAIDVYPEYTGTIAFELLGRKTPATLDELAQELAPLGLGAAVPLGFNNTYALAMREERAAALGITRISDLARHPELKPGISQEFLNRKDGWVALKQAYRLPFAAPRGLDHGLAYEALAAGQVDVIDIYTTDAKIAKYRLRVLADDRGFFPAYEAVLIYRLDLPKRFPASWAALQKLQGRIPAQRMIALNAEVELSGASFAAAARQFLAAPDTAGDATRDDRRPFYAVLFGNDLGRLTLQHLLLVFVSLALSVAVGIPLGIRAARSPRAAYWIMAAVGTLQTIPSLALLAFLIALLGSIGTVPAIVALFLYALLPIVRNTHSGLVEIAAPLQGIGAGAGAAGRSAVEAGRAAAGGAPDSCRHQDLGGHQRRHRDHRRLHRRRRLWRTHCRGTGGQRQRDVAGRRGARSGAGVADQVGVRRWRTGWSRDGLARKTRARRRS